MQHVYKKSCYRCVGYVWCSALYPREDDLNLTGDGVERKGFFPNFINIGGLGKYESTGFSVCSLVRRGESIKSVG